jgi:hypothetical protein
MAELFADVGGNERAALRGLIVRRAVVLLFLAIIVAALLDVFGQRQSAATATAPAVTLRVRAPTKVRGGLLFQTRIDAQVRRGFERPRLVFDPGVLEGMQVSSIEPGAMSESSRDGRLELSYPPVIAGDRLRIWLQFQVDPTAPLGRRSYGIELDEGTRRVARVERTLTVLP